MGKRATAAKNAQPKNNALGVKVAIAPSAHFVAALRVLPNSLFFLGCACSGFVPPCPAAAYATISNPRKVIFAMFQNFQSPLESACPTSQTPVYFGGTRGYVPLSLPVSSVVLAVLGSGAPIHVGCQYGVDALVSFYALLNPSSLVVFAVSPTLLKTPSHVYRAAHAGARVVLAAGGNAPSIKAAFMRRSIAAFTGCSAAVFFAPGSGSLSVAAQCLKSSMPVYVFDTTPPAAIAKNGAWVSGEFISHPCYQWVSL